MKVAIKKIEYMPVARIFSWSHVGRNDSLNVSNFVDGPYNELKFTPLSASLEEEWMESTSGNYSQVKVSGVIRADKMAMRNILSSLVVTRNIFRITCVNEQKYVVGSLDFTPKTLFKLIISELTTSEYQFTITCKSPHGIVYDTSV